MQQRSACLVFSTDTRGLEQFSVLFFSFQPFVFSTRQAIRQTGKTRTFSCLQPLAVVASRGVCAICVRVRDSCTSKSRGRKVRDYLWRNNAAIMLMKMHFPTRLPVVEGGAGQGERGSTGCHLKKETANFVFFANKPCQPTQSQPPIAARQLVSPSVISQQSSAISRLSSVLSPHSSVLGPPSTVLCPPSAVRCLC